jgi:hypothetical protein
MHTLCGKTKEGIPGLSPGIHHVTTARRMRALVSPVVRCSAMACHRFCSCSARTINGRPGQFPRHGGRHPACSSPRRGASHSDGLPDASEVLSEAPSRRLIRRTYRSPCSSGKEGDKNIGAHECVSAAREALHRKYSCRDPLPCGDGSVPRWDSAMGFRRLLTSIRKNPIFLFQHTLRASGGCRCGEERLQFLCGNYDLPAYRSIPCSTSIRKEIPCP